MISSVRPITACRGTRPSSGLFKSFSAAVHNSQAKVCCQPWSILIQVKIEINDTFSKNSHVLA